MADAEPAPGRFLTLDDVAAELATSKAQVYALVRRDQLAAIKLGGRGQWRVERTALEDFITAAYADTRRWVADHPFTDPETDTDPGDGPDPDSPEA